MKYLRLFADTFCAALGVGAAIIVTALLVRALFF